MKMFALFYALSCAIPLQAAAALPGSKHNTATVQNFSQETVTITYRRTDPGFKGPHVIVKDTEKLYPNQAVTIKAYSGKRKNAAATFTFGPPENNKKITFALGANDLIKIKALNNGTQISSQADSYLYILLNND